MTDVHAPDGVTIRPATPADVPDLFDVRTSVRENHLSLEELARLGVTPESVERLLTVGGRGWVAGVDGRIVGFTIAIAEQGTVFALFLRPACEGRGIGRALLARAEEWLFEIGHDQIWLLTDASPAVRANGFYRHLRWIAAGIEPDGQVKFVKTRARSEGVQSE